MAPRKRTRLGGPSFSIAACASLDEVAWHWARRRAIEISSVHGAQRELELRIHRMPVNERAYCAQWRRTVRRWVALGRINPRAGLMPRGHWVDWLAERALSEGDVIDEPTRARILCELKREAILYMPVGTRRHRQLWRPMQPVGLRGLALALVRERGGTRLEIVATRDRPALLERMRDRMRERRRQDPALTRDNNRRQRDRGRRAKSELRQRLGVGDRHI